MVLLEVVGGNVLFGETVYMKDSTGISELIYSGFDGLNANLIMKSECLTPVSLNVDVCKYNLFASRPK